MTTQYDNTCSTLANKDKTLNLLMKHMYTKRHVLFHVNVLICLVQILRDQKLVLIKEAKLLIRLLIKLRKGKYMSCVDGYV